MISRKIIYPIAIVICFAAFFVLGVWFGATQYPYNVVPPDNLNLSLFYDAYNKLQENFIDKSKIDNQKVVYGAIEGMTKSLGDPYTTFFDPGEARLFSSDLAGSFEGIGAEIGIKNDQLTVIAPLKGTPAEKAGLKSGDVILKIDDKDASHLSTDEAVNLIRGKKGTSVTLTMFRDGWSSPKDITITREMIKIPSTNLEFKGDVALISIYQFDESLPVDFKAEVHEILQSPAKKIIIDLRDDPGGYLEVAQEIAGYFLPKGQVVTIESFGQAKTEQQYKTAGNGELINYPTVVLINQGSASASEILAGALRDNRGVQLIGTKSFGKGSVQQVIDLRDGSFLKITVAKWLTPKGTSISEIGLTPDIKITISDQDVLNKKDPQLDKALEIIKNLK